MGDELALSLSERFPPPSNFRRIERVQSARLTTKGPLGADPWRPRGTEAQVAGVRYEQRAHGYLGELLSGRQGPVVYAPSQWIHFVADGRAGWAQPDGLILDFKRGILTLVEIKLRHTTSAWWALRHMYEPLIRHLFGPAWRYACLEVTRWYQPMAWPEPFTMTPEPASLGAHEFGIHIWHDRDWEWKLARHPRSKAAVQSGERRAVGE